MSITVGGGAGWQGWCDCDNNEVFVDKTIALLCVTGWARCYDRRFGVCYNNEVVLTKVIKLKLLVEVIRLLCVMREVEAERVMVYNLVPTEKRVWVWRTNEFLLQGLGWDIAIILETKKYDDTPSDRFLNYRFKNFWSTPLRTPMVLIGIWVCEKSNTKLISL